MSITKVNSHSTELSHFKSFITHDIIYTNGKFFLVTIGVEKLEMDIHRCGPQLHASTQKGNKNTNEINILSWPLFSFENNKWDED